MLDALLVKADRLEHLHDNNLPVDVSLTHSDTPCMTLAHLFTVGRCQLSVQEHYPTTG
jgi:hypothetical protein